MATCDPDGRIAQALRDRHICLGIEMAEHVRSSTAPMSSMLDALAELVLDPADPDATT